MKHNLSKPCAECPFRTDIKSYLRPKRAEEICESLMNGHSFPCHKTTDYDCLDQSQCAGAEIYLAKQGMSTQMSRIAERLGFTVATLDMDAPVFGSMSEMIEAQTKGCLP